MVDPKKFVLGSTTSVLGEAFQQTLQKTYLDMLQEREKVLAQHITTGGTSGIQLSDYLIVECQGGWQGLTAWLRGSSDEWVIVTPLPALAPNAAMLVRRLR